MSSYSYNEIVNRAIVINKNVKEKYNLGLTQKWSYYFAKAILNPKTDIKKIDFKKESKSQGDYISRQISKTDYLKLAKKLVNYVESNKQLPNWLTWGKFRLTVRMYTYLFSRVLEYYDTHAQFRSEANLFSKAFVKPTEYPNKVYGLWVKYIKTKPKMLDDVCDYVKTHFNYQFYYDDQKSNEEVLKSKSGNCTDLLQMLINMAEAMDYDWQVHHVRCNRSGTGHVYGMFKKKGTSNWFIRDIACIADESRYCIWCEAGNGGSLIAKNPSWFTNNLNR